MMGDRCRNVRDQLDQRRGARLCCVKAVDDLASEGPATAQVGWKVPPGDGSCWLVQEIPRVFRGARTKDGRSGRPGRQEVEHVAVGRPDDTEVAVVERGVRREVEPFGDGDEGSTRPRRNPSCLGCAARSMAPPVRLRYEQIAGSERVNPGGFVASARWYVRPRQTLHRAAVTPDAVTPDKTDRRECVRNRRRLCPVRCQSSIGCATARRQPRLTRWGPST